VTEVARRWTAADIPDLAGRRFLVTGANSGLGYETARALARHGAHVLMAVRNQEKGRAALDTITRETPGAGAELVRLDLADLASVRELATALLDGGQPIDVLVNNAGIMMPPRRLSTDGFESQFAANHLGHFALTGLLLPLLRRGSDARVVTVTSGLHRGGSIHFDDLTGEREYSPTGFYQQSKFANVLFGLELDRRLRAAGVPVASVLAHPGFAATNLQRVSPTGLRRVAVAIGTTLLSQPAERGAWSQLYAATAPGVEGGQFFGPAGRTELRGHPAGVRPDPKATDPETARRLWEVSSDLTGVTYGF
jgi:NAD(P)-dependent dehydrogenase (short-subunit alcohol dehydrogenase family)